MAKAVPHRVQAQDGLLASGVSGLDDVLGGGFVPHRLYLVEGNPGAGKTTLALQYLLTGASRGETVLYVTLSESKAELVSVAASHGWSLDHVPIIELIAGEAELEADTQLTMYQPSEVQLGETIQAVLKAVERLNPSRVVIDSLSELRLLSQGPLKYRRQILALKQFFVARKCTVLMLDDRTGDIVDTQLQSIAHGVLSLEQLAPEYGAERRRLRVLKYRGTQYRGGFHDFCIVPGGIAVYPRLVAAEHEQPFTASHLPSGVARLDQMLGGGPDRGTSTIMIGPAGSGKSTVAAQYAIAAAKRGDHAVMFNFDEGLATLVTRMDALGLGLSECVRDGSIKVHAVDPAELSPGEFSHLVRKAVEDGGAKVVVIDSLNGYLNAMPEERFLVIQLHELLTYLARLGATTMLVVAQHGIVGSNMMTPVDASYLADSVVLFRFYEYAGKVKKAISVMKKRSGAHEESIRELRMGPNGITLSEPLAAFQGILTGVPVQLSPRDEPSADADADRNGDRAAGISGEVLR